MISQQDKGQSAGAASSDPNTLYQQQLQWKTKSTLNTQNGEELKAGQNAIASVVTRTSDSTKMVTASKNG